jgi:hypothetical protein
MLYSYLWHVGVSSESRTHTVVILKKPTHQQAANTPAAQQTPGTDEAIQLAPREQNGALWQQKTPTMQKSLKTFNLCICCMY